MDLPGPSAAQSSWSMIQCSPGTALGFQCFDLGVDTVADALTELCRIAGLYVDVQQDLRAARCFFREAERD